MNLDGANDLIVVSVVGAPNIGVLYNNPANPGILSNIILLYNSAAVDLSIGDLNNDGRPDLVIPDEGSDKYKLNLGNDSSGLALFQQLTFVYQPGQSSSWGGESVIADLDNDGFNDVLITDVHFLIGMCESSSSRLHIFHNLGNVPSVTLQDQAPPVIPANMLTGAHDVAVFDINGDGWNDLVIGRCTGTQVWMNQPPDIECASDINGDDEVNVDDLLIMINHWGQCPAPPDACWADIEPAGGDGEVNVDDFLAVINGWGPCP